MLFGCLVRWLLVWFLCLAALFLRWLVGWWALRWWMDAWMDAGLPRVPAQFPPVRVVPDSPCAVSGGF